MLQSTTVVEVLELLELVVVLSDVLGALVLVDVVTVVLVVVGPTSSGCSVTIPSWTSRGVQTSRIFTVVLNVRSFRVRAQRTAARAGVAIDRTRRASKTERMPHPYQSRAARIHRCAGIELRGSATVLPSGQASPAR